MNRPNHFFNIESADQLFSLLKTVASRLATSDEKQIEDFLLLVFGLTHLREWVAPDYNWKERTPITPEEHFFQEIWEFDEFKLLQSLCNRSKHMCPTDSVMGTVYKSELGRRFLVGYIANGKDVEEVVNSVIKFYEERWFHKPT